MSKNSRSAAECVLICRIYSYFEQDCKRKAPFYSWENVYQRTCHAIGINITTLVFTMNTVRIYYCNPLVNPADWL